MQTVILKRTELKNVTWPQLCPACNTPLECHKKDKKPDETLCSWPVSVTRGLRVLWDRSKKSELRVDVCGRCYEQLGISKYATDFGVALECFAFGGYILLSMLGAATIVLTLGAGATFWLGFVLVLIGNWGQRTLLGVRVRQTLGGNWRFRFASREFADHFRKANTNQKACHKAPAGAFAAIQS